MVANRRYITYGEEEWRDATARCLEKMELYDTNGVQHKFV